MIGLGNIYDDYQMIPRWLLSTVAALFCWGLWAILPRFLGQWDTFTGGQIQAFSTLGMLPVMIALGFTRSVRNEIRNPRGTLLAVAAGTCGCIGNVLYYEILKAGEKATTVVPLTALYPLVTVLLAVPLLREKLNRTQLFGIVLAFVAIYLFNVQQTQGFLSRWLLVILVPILLWGVAGLLQKIATNHISGEMSTLWFLAASVPAAIFLFMREGSPSYYNAKELTIVLLIGFMFALGNYGILDAFAAGGKASIITPISGLYSMVSIPIAIIFLGERLGLRELLAIAIALAAIVAISLESKAEVTNEKISA